MKIHPFGFALIGVIGYLSYHAIAGQQGLSSWTAMQADVAELTELRDEKITRKAELLEKIRALYPETLDGDYLEELARKKFHFVYAGELVMEPPRTTSQLPKNEELLDLSKR